MLIVLFVVETKSVGICLGTIRAPAKMAGQELDPRMMNARIWTNAPSAWTTATPLHPVLIQTEASDVNAWKDF